MIKSVLIVDDDPTQRRLLEAAVSHHGYHVRCAASGHEAVEILESREALEIDLVLLDIVMPDLNGIEVLERVHPHLPMLPVIMLTAHSSVNLIVQAMRAGAIDYIIKPASPERIKVSIDNALKLNALSGEVSRLSRRQTGRLRFSDIVGHSRELREAMDLARRAADTNVPILIEGESGVGKEMFARAIQSCGDRADQPLVIVNCGALPENLVESILFGHEKGAFTGAVERHRGKFQEASGGTLFLDEIGELRPDIQVKLLRALQDGDIDPVGGDGPIKVDIRLISATNRRLEDLVREGLFREDLFYRLNVFPVRIPPLRERRDDIPELVKHFINQISVAEGKKVRGISPQAQALLRDFAWPGNVRQLENAIFRAVVLCDGPELTEHDFPQIVKLRDAGGRSTFENAVDTPALRQPTLPDARGNGAQERPAFAHAAGAIPVVDDTGDLRQIRDIEAEVIAFAMHKYRGRMSEIARRLGIGRSTLYRKVTDLGLDSRSGDRN